MPKSYPRAVLARLRELPTALREVDQWVCWRLVERAQEKTAKVPVNPRTGREASVTDGETWADFQTALARFERDPALAGVGFVFTAEDPFTGVDVDDCRDPATGELGPWAQELVAQLATYAEVSPSGTGIKLVVEGAAPGAATRRAKVEIYSAARYFTLTGERLAGAPAEVCARQAALTALYELVFGRVEPAPAPPPADPAKLARVRELPDDTLLELARRAANGEKFQRLWAGELGDHGGDRSAADLALCALLAYWTRADAARVDRLFRRSGLVRPKWDARRGGTTYGALTVARACAGAAVLYDPDRFGADDWRPNDVGNARIFLELHGGDFTYALRQRDWLVFDGHRWRPRAKVRLLERARDVATHLLARAAATPEGDERRRRARWALAAGESYRLSSLEQVLRSDLWTDRGWNADPYLLACANGVVDLRTGTLRDGRREDGVTRGTEVAYRAEAACPRFERFLAELAEGDADLVRYLWRVVGYCLTGDVTERAFFILHGVGRNGKTTFVDTLLALLGEYGQRARFSTFLTKHATGGANEDVAALAGARLVVASEAEEAAALSVALIKELTGGDRVRARHLYAEEFEFRPQLKLFLVVNHVPQIRESSHALWDRLHYVPFNYRVPEEAVDRALPLKLLGELEGILAKAVRASLEWQRDGLAPPARVLRLRDELRVSMDVVAEFLEECCERVPAADGHRPPVVAHNALYAALRRWLRERGVRWTPKSRGFGEWLREQGFTERRSGARQWEGLRLRGALPLAEDDGAATEL